MSDDRESIVVGREDAVVGKLEREKSIVEWMDEMCLPRRIDRIVPVQWRCLDCGSILSKSWCSRCEQPAG